MVHKIERYMAKPIRYSMDVKGTHFGDIVRFVRVIEMQPYVLGDVILFKLYYILYNWIFYNSPMLIN